MEQAGSHDDLVNRFSGMIFFIEVYPKILKNVEVIVSEAVLIYKAIKIH